MDKYLGIIADTHLNDRGKLPYIIKKHFKGADGIIHAGDLTNLDILQELKLIAPVWAVYGNMDGSDVRKELPEKRIIEWQGKRIGIMHRSKNKSRGNPEEILPSFSQDNIDCLIFGHSHKPFNKEISGILCFNPGSTSPQYGNAPSIGYLYLEKSTLTAKIEPL